MMKHLKRRKKMKQTITFKFSVGEKVENFITGFQGTITGECYYLSGCRQYLVRPRMVIKDGEQHKQPDAHWFDEEVLKLLDTVVKIDAKPSGGPRHGDEPSCN